MLMSQPMMFREFATEEAMIYRNANLREDCVTSYEVMARTTLQRIMEMVVFSQRHPGLDHQQLSELWNKNVKKSVSALSEEVTANYVKLSIDVYNKALQHPCLAFF